MLAVMDEGRRSWTISCRPSLSQEDGDSKVRIKGKSHDLNRKVSPTLLECLAHPVRREALRVLHRSPVALSPAEMAKDSIDFSLAGLSHHVRVLDRMNVVRRERVEEKVVTKSFYVSNVAENDIVVAILAATEEDDEYLARSQKT